MPSFYRKDNEFSVRKLSTMSCDQVIFTLLWTGMLSWCAADDAFWISLGSRCYLIGEEHVTWDEAKSRCLSVKGALLKVDTPLEDEFITGIINYTNSQYWVDAKWNPTANKVLWSDGSEVPSYLWLWYEPNLTGDCVRYYAGENDTGKRLGDNPCINNYSYICEKNTGAPYYGKMGIFKESVASDMCSIVSNLENETRISCGNRCLKDSECDGFVYRNKLCTIFKFSGISGTCGTTLLPTEDQFRVNKCYSELMPS